MMAWLGGRGGQDEGEGEVGDETVCPAVDGIHSVLARSRPVQRRASLPDEGEVDPPTLDANPERPADDAEAHLRATPGRRRRVARLRPLVAGHDRAGPVTLDRIDDRHLPL